jgi:cell division protein FtsQ
MEGRQRPIPTPEQPVAARTAARGRRSAQARGGGLRSRLAASLADVGRAGYRFACRRPQRAGVIAMVLLVGATLAYGAHRGDHFATVTEFLRDLRNEAANAAGFKIATLAINGRKELSEVAVMDSAGITANTSLLFLDVTEVREKLESSPWIARATVRKFYPNHLEISIEERQAFALWQKDGKLSVIAVDGTPLVDVEETAVPRLPLVVGPGAAVRAHDFLSLIDRYPVLHEQMRAAILVADRRWNLLLKSGLAVRLPEEGVAAALDTLVALDRDKKILSRDITAIDLRLPDRLTVRLSDDAAKAREQALQDKKKKKGGSA